MSDLPPCSCCDEDSVVICVKRASYLMQPSIKKAFGDLADRIEKELSKHIEVKND